MVLHPITENEFTQKRSETPVKSASFAEDRNRRIFLQASAHLAVSIPVMIGGIRAAFAGETSHEIVSTLQSAARAEMNAYNRYLRFARKARTEGYKGVSYLFIALATSELIHAQNYNRLLTKTGADIVPSGNPGIEIANTRNNLIAAAKGELNSITIFYPKVLDTIADKANSGTIKVVRYAWESHKQHIEFIDKIIKYAPSFFEVVARKIDEKSDAYNVCGICGSTANEVPKQKCPICGYPVGHYEKIDPSAFLG